MEIEDLKQVSRFGQALWAEPVRSERVAVDTLAAVSLLGLPEDRVLERATQALLQRAVRDGAAAAGPGIHNAFYRLSPEERLVLSALHLGRWSYARIARVLELTPERVAEIAWAARLHLVSAPGQQRPVPHPVGSSRNGIQCPDYNPQRPWTQRFLDTELSPADRVFLQEHLLVCASCRQALQICRQVYYSAEIRVPKHPEEERGVALLDKALQRVELQKDPSRITLGQSLWIFFSRPEVRLALALVLIALVRMIF